MDGAKIFGIVALKGGVGKTTVVENLGASLARDFNKKVLMIDANFSTPHLGLHVGLINPPYTLHSALNGEYPVYEAIYQHDLGFHIIPGRLSSPITDAEALRDAIAPLRDIYDVILIDSSPSLDKEMLATMMAADELLVVSSPDYPTLSSTIHAVDVARSENIPIRGIVLNKVHNKRFEIPSKDVADASEVKVLAKLPEDIKVLSALAQMMPVVVYSPRQDISKNYKVLAASLIDMPSKTSGKPKKPKTRKKSKKEE